MRPYFRRTRDLQNNSTTKLFSIKKISCLHRYLVHKILDYQCCFGFDEFLQSLGNDLALV